jgi:D-alanyl-D-alanine carboxypeptidase
MRILVLVSTLVLMTLTVATPAGAGDASKLQRQLDALVQTEGGPPGAIVVVQRGEDQHVFTAGVSDLAADAPIDEQQHVRVASVAKAFTGAVALALVDQGVLSLDDTIAERLPQYTEWGEVTLRQLLAHTSGIPEFATRPAFQESVAAAPETPPPPSQLISAVDGAPLEFEPGSRYRYVNTDNVLVGLMIEQATGRSYTDVLQTEVADRLGLSSTTLPSGSEMPQPFVHGYDVSDPIQPEDVSELIAAGWAWAAGGIVSTPADMTRFVRGYVGGELFGPDLVKEERRALRVGGKSEPPGPGANSAGMSIFRYKTRCGTVYGHTGNTLGYTELVAASPDGERSVTFTVTNQMTPETSDVFPALRKAEATAVCTALEGD